MKLSTIADDGDVVSLRCDSDMSNVDFRGDEPLSQLIGQDGFKRLVLLNMEKVRFLDSSGISWLLIRHKHFKENGGRLVVHSLPPLVRQPLEFMNLTKVLHIAGDEKAARSMAHDG